jgi:hypothetical protein
MRLCQISSGSSNAGKDNWPGVAIPILAIGYRVVCMTGGHCDPENTAKNFIPWVPVAKGIREEIGVQRGMTAETLRLNKLMRKRNGPWALAREDAATCETGVANLQAPTVPFFPPYFDGGDLFRVPPADWCKFLRQPSSYLTELRARLPVCPRPDRQPVNMMYSSWLVKANEIKALFAPQPHHAWTAALNAMARLIAYHRGKAAPAITACAHGPVLPCALQGSSVQYKVAPAALAPACAIAITSA